MPSISVIQSTDRQRSGSERKALATRATSSPMTTRSNGPAANVGLKQRGLIREGYFADITIFDPKTVIDRATFEDPNQYPVGIDYVIVNGQIEVDNGRRTAALAGRVLRGPGYSSHR